MNQQNTFTIDRHDADKILKDFLRGTLHFSDRSIIALKKCGGVTINGENCHMNMILKENDVIKIAFQDTDSENILPEKMELDIVYEDEHLIVLNKGPHMPVHPVKKHVSGTLANGLAYYFLSLGKSIKIRPVNRLDKDTSGLVIFAKSAHIQHLLSFYVGKEELKKEYIALVHGQMEQEAGTIDLPIAREEEKALRRMVRADGGRAVTHFRTEAVFDDYSVVRLILETGRTHQIRVHMAHIGHPLLGDTMYGGSTGLIGRQALHAVKITMLHPITKEWHSFEAAIPEDIRRLIL